MHACTCHHTRRISPSWLSYSTSDMRMLYTSCSVAGCLKNQWSLLVRGTSLRMMCWWSCSSELHCSLDSQDSLRHVYSALQAVNTTAAVGTAPWCDAPDSGWLC